MKKFEDFLEFIRRKGWRIEEYGAGDEKINIPAVYAGKAGEIEATVRRYAVIENPEQTVWFVTGECLEDETDESAGFRWDTFKNISIAASADGGKSEREWWDKRFPFICPQAAGMSFLR